MRIVRVKSWYKLYAVSYSNFLLDSEHVLTPPTCVDIVRGRS